MEPVLAEGQELRLNSQGEDITALTPAALDAAGAWRRGEIIFDGDTLGAAVAEYNRYLTRPISIANGELADLRLGGRFTTRDPSDFLAAAETAFGLEANQHPNGAIVLSRRESAPNE
jgi:transmembrane sensor